MHRFSLALSILVLLATHPTASGAADLLRAATPLRFEENLGQTDEHVRFLARSVDGTVFLTPGEIVATIGPAGDVPPVRLLLAGASPTAMFGTGRLPGRSHYLKGNDESAWRRDVPAYRCVRYADAWPGVDLSVYGTPDRHLEFDVVAAPHADLERVRLRVPGVTSAAIEADGTVALTREEGVIRLRLPAVWQVRGGSRRPVDGRFVVHGFDASGVELGFALEGRDPSRTVVIDPVLEYSSYLGASSVDEALDLAVDQEGCAYVLGFTQSPDFPLLNALDDSVGTSDIDAFVTKFSADGSSIVYSTYLGGNRDDAFVYGGIDVDASGVAYVGGITGGGTFPVTGGAYQTTPGGLNDGFVSAIAPDGGSLLWSTFLGGSQHDRCVGVAVDELGNVFATGLANSADFPLTPGAFDTTLVSTEIWVAQLNGGGLVFSTFVGGSGSENAHGIAARAGTPYVCGESFSNDFPVVGAVAVSDSGSFDAVAFRLNSTGTGLLFSTYLPGEAKDVGWGIAVDSDSSVYVCGTTDSDDFLTTPGALQETHPTEGFFNVDAAFVTKLGAGGSPIVYSTFLGGTGYNRAWSIDVRNGEAVVSGTTTATDFPLVNSFQMPMASYDAFVTQFASDGGSLLFSTLLAGNSGDNSRDGAGGVVWDDQGSIFVSGTTSSDNFPTTPGAYQESDPGQGSGVDAFVAKIQPSALTGAPATAAASGTDALELTGGPNPFRGSVRIEFTLPAPADARLDIVDVTGRRVRTLEGRGLPAGTSTVRWDGRNEHGARAAAGVYLVRLTAGNRTAVARLVLVR